MCFFKCHGHTIHFFFFLCFAFIWTENPSSYCCSVARWWCVVWCKFPIISIEIMECENNWQLSMIEEWIVKLCSFNLVSSKNDAHDCPLTCKCGAIPNSHWQRFKPVSLKKIQQRNDWTIWFNFIYVCANGHIMDQAAS